MKILAIDTTHEFGSLALAEDDAVIETVALHAPDGFSVVLFGYIEEILRRHSLRVGDIDVFAAASGPGSFTGVRVGLTAMKALAEATGRPCYGVSNLAAMAEFGSLPVRVAVTDARRGEIYAGVYRDGVGEEIVAPWDVIVGELPDEPLEFIGFDFGMLNAELPGKMTIIPRDLAAQVARLSWARYRAGDNGDPAAVDANYVRRSDAENMWKEA